MDHLKAKVTSAPVLRSSELDKQFEVEVNALGYAIGAVLLQRKEDGKKHPIAYLLRFLLVRYALLDRLTSGLSVSFIPHPSTYAQDCSLLKLLVDVAFTYCLSD